MRASIFLHRSNPLHVLPHPTELEVDDRAFAHIYTYAHTYTHSYTYIRNAALLLLLYCRLFFLLFARFSERTKKRKRGDRQTAANEFGAHDCQITLFLSTLFEYVRAAHLSSSDRRIARDDNVRSVTRALLPRRKTDFGFSSNVLFFSRVILNYYNERD